MTDARKVTDLIKENKFTYSFEVTPDVNKDDLIGLEADPSFFSVTWHAKTHKCKDFELGPLKLAEFLRAQQKQVMMHLSCDMMRKQFLEEVLAFLQEKGIFNLFLILGESYDPSTSDFKSTLELIQYIRKISGQYFCIGIAGFCECVDEKILHLKEKIDAGADFIVTQAFFEVKIYKDFVTKCERAGINVPVIPGVFPFQNYKQLTKFKNMCKVKVCNDILEYVKNNKGHEFVSAEITKNLVHSINSEFSSAHFHFFTMNNVNNVCRIIKEIQKYNLFCLPFPIGDDHVFNIKSPWGRYTYLIKADKTTIKTKKKKVYVDVVVNLRSYLLSLARSTFGSILN